MTHPHVTSDPGIRGGEACITGTRIPAALVAGLVNDGMPPAKIKTIYAGVSAAAARAAAAWASDPGTQMPPSEIDSAQ